MSLITYLNKLEKQLQFIEAPVLSYFLEGVSQVTVNELFRQSEIVPTTELLELYQWHNGLKYPGIPSGKLCFGLNGVFLPLQDSLAIYKKSIQKDFPGMFPVFCDDIFMINLNRDSRDFNKIFIYNPALLINEPQSCYDTLENMIETFIECFQAGAFYYDENGFFEENFDISTEISRKLNPNSMYWDAID